MFLHSYVQFLEFIILLYFGLAVFVTSVIVVYVLHCCLLISFHAGPQAPLKQSAHTGHYSREVVYTHFLTVN